MRGHAVFDNSQSSVLAVCVMAALTLGNSASAQSYPARTVKFVVPYGPGTGVDVAARIVAERLSKNLVQPFVVENRAGASGTIATAAVAVAPPDGYTLLVSVSSHTSVPALMKNLPFDAARDFTGVAVIAESPLVLVTSRARGFASVKDLIAAAKAKPGTVSFASAGVGTTTHIAAEKFRIAAGFEALHVPFKSTTDALGDVMSGRIDYLYTTLVSALGGVKDGRLVALALGARRTPLLPGTPTIVEAGVPDAEYSTWFGILAPAKTPRDIVTRLHAETGKVLAAQDVRERMAAAGAEHYALSLEEFEALLRREFLDNERLIKAAGIKLD
jgi:tripartite-type tricarboxylate transporter receptor subunit TctC